MKLDAATGATEWARKFSPPESFGKLAYADIGFLNGPILVDTADGLGGKRQLLVSGSKGGTIYAVRADDGQPVWSTQVVPTPSFAGFGVFNGAINQHNGKILAALNDTGLRPPAKHFVAFSAVDGKIVWSDEIGASYGSVQVAGNVAYVGTNAANVFYTYDADTGKRLGAFPMPGNVAGKAAVDGDMVFIGWGTSASGGLRAFRAK
jgi:outer membrane protein assembly factor BamB